MSDRQRHMQVPIEELEVNAYRIGLDEPESDGTLEWNATTIVVAQAQADGMTGVGYTYNDTAAARLADKKFRPIVMGHDALAVEAAWNRMYDAIRNIGQPGVAAAAISAVDTALWDLKARLLEIPLVTLLDDVHNGVPVYGSGGFTSYSDERLHRQFSSWTRQGISMVKMKVGRHPERDLERVRMAREAIGDDGQLMIDANGAFSRKQALDFAGACDDYNVTWFEEPVSSDDLRGLRLLCQRAPASMEIAAGEYGYNRFYFRRMLDADAVDVLQVDATRCGGFTGFLKAATLASAYNVDISAHTAPTLHTHVCCAVTNIRHIEYFYDHTRAEPLLFDHALEPVDSTLQPDRDVAGTGLRLKRVEAERHEAYSSRATVSG